MGLQYDSEGIIYKDLRMVDLFRSEGLRGSLTTLAQMPAGPLHLWGGVLKFLLLKTFFVASSLRSQLTLMQRKLQLSISTNLQIQKFSILVFYFQNLEFSFDSLRIGFFSALIFTICNVDNYFIGLFNFSYLFHMACHEWNEQLSFGQYFQRL